jgi:hypothetical protein
MLCLSLLFLSLSALCCVCNCPYSCWLCTEIIKNLIIMECHCDNLLERLHLLTLQNRLLHFDALFLINILPRVECCLPALLTASIWNIRNFNMFTCSSASASLLPKVQFVKLQVFLEALVRILKPKIIHLSLILLFTLLFLVSFILN